MKLQTHKKIELQHRNRLGTVSKKTTGGFNQFYSRETSPLILMQLQITNICSVRLAVLYLIFEKSQWNKCNTNCDEIKQTAQRRSETSKKENHIQD